MDFLNSPWFVLGISSVVLLLVWLAKRYGFNLPISVNPDGLPPQQQALLAFLEKLLARHADEKQALIQQLGPQPVPDPGKYAQALPQPVFQAVAGEATVPVTFRIVALPATESPK